jgi:UDP-N-acetylmuramoyl-tripeptide--D-alanyl-D-alanine ligase
MERSGLKRRIAHALPELVWLNDGLQESVAASQPVRWPLRQAARIQRRRLNSVLFVAVTGSFGKSTTKALTAAVLRSRLAGTSTPRNANSYNGVAKMLLRTSPEHDFSVLELGTDSPGMLRQLTDLVRPRIGVVTSVGLEHVRNFGSLDAIAGEKCSLVQALPPEGVAVLNADDPQVLAMGEACAGRVVTVGLGAGATFRAEDVRSSWPDALSFTLWHHGRAVTVRTRLYGRHWTQPVLAAIAVGLEAGVPLVDAVRAVEAVEALRGRMQPVDCADGVTFLRDDVKHSLLTAARALDFVEEARAARKVVVIGRIVNFEGDPYVAYAELAERALEVADEVIFTGPQARYAPEPKNGQRLRILPTVKEASEYLRETIRPGDLVLLKASNRTHLGRILLAHTREVACWLSSCGRIRLCEDCELLDFPSEPNSPLPARLLPARPQTPDPE